MKKYQFRLAIAGLLAAAYLLVPATVKTQSRGVERETFNGQPVVAGEVLVRLRDTTSLADIARQADADDDRPVGNGGWRRIHSNSRGVAALMTAMAARPDVLEVEPNYILEAVAIPNDFFFGALWGMRSGAGTRAELAWNLTTGSTATVVGVIDSGVDYTHPDLVANMWSAPTAFTVTVGGRSITCPAGSHGFNAILFSCDPADDNNHGTHVSGTIGASGNNGLGVVGVNWTTRIMGLKFLDASGSGSTADAINAVDFAIQVKNFFAASKGANVRVLSNSYGGGGNSTSFQLAINRANAADMLFAAAAGNQGSNIDAAPFYPASYTNANIVSVAAIDESDNRAGFSNYGATAVDLGAPGVNIMSTTPGNNYSSWGGTSMATPHVSGAAALLLAVCPALTTAQIKAAILNNVDPSAGMAGITVTSGRLNIDRALRSCATAPSVTLLSPGDGATYSAPASVSLSASASDPDGIARVDFYLDGVVVATSTTAPFGGSVNGVTAGSHTLYAVAVDAVGMSSTSSTVTVNVNAAGAPVGPAPGGETLLTTQAPAAFFSDGVPYELGVRVVPDVDGQFTAVRFWKAPLDTSTSHVGHIWSASGTLLATVTFGSETASGWQQQSLSSPLAVTANTEYVISVNTPNYFPDTQNAFAAGLVNGHLRAVAGANGVFGAPNTFPTSNYLSSNYFRDVVFSPGGGSATGATLLTSQTPAAFYNDGVPHELGVRIVADVAGQFTALRFWKAPLDAATSHVGHVWSATGTLLATVTFTGETASGWQQQALPTPVSVAANTEYVISVDSQNYFADTQNAFGAGLINGNLRAVSGGNGVFGPAGAFPTGSYLSSNYFRDVVFVAGAPGSETLLTTQVPAAFYNDGVPHELGVRIVADVAGQFTAIRFWKAPLDTATSHVGRIWSAGGTLLATVTFSGESASGWQQQALSAPLAVAANTEYVVSVNAATYFADTQNAFGTGLINGHLRAVAGSNGVFAAPGVFPTSSYLSSNYFRDVVFVAGSAPATLNTQVYASGFITPVAFVQDPSNTSRQFVAEKGGHVRAVVSGVVESADFLDLSEAVSTDSERGLLGLAFSPDYSTSGRFFVNFTNVNGDTVVARFKRSANPLLADPASRFDLAWGGPGGSTVIPQPFANHNGGHLAFGPDGMLYIGLGDGGDANDPGHRAQSPSDLLGKMLRIDVQVPDADLRGYRIPADNPFLDGAPVVARGEIWAFGLRNPWRYSFDDPLLGGTGALVIGDVGQDGWEEINYEPAGQGGRNYGWRNYEGTHAHINSLPPAFPDLTLPIFEYDHTVGHSVTGGHVYRGNALSAAYRGRYFFGDFIQRRIWSVALTADDDGGTTASDLIEHTGELGGSAAVGNVSAFGVDSQGELYIVSYSAGRILKIVS